MGYNTEFEGQFNLDKPMTLIHHRYLTKFSEIRHMNRDAKKLVDRPDPVREAAGLPLGVGAAFFVSQW